MEEKNKKDVIVIGVAGRKRSGKDEFLKVLSDQFPPGSVAKLAFADPLKEEAAKFLADTAERQWVEKFAKMANLTIQDSIKVFNPIFEFLSDFDENEAHLDFEFFLNCFNSDDHKHHFRLLLQYWGTEYRRAQDDQYWLKAWALRLQDLVKKGVKIVCAPDVRFPNEHDFLMQNGAYLYKVTRPSLDDGSDLHASETALDGEDVYWDDEIVNDGTLDEYKHKVIDSLSMRDLLEAA